MKAAERSPLFDARGAVYVEFVLVVVPVVLLFMVTVQLALIASAQLVVQHAATRAARAAIVVLEDDPGRYGVLRGALRGGRSSSSSRGLEIVGAVFGQSAGARPPSNAGTASPQSGARMQDIRLAAYAPLAVLAPALGELVTPSSNLGRALGASSLARIAGGMALYNRFASAVTLRSGSNDVPDTIGPNAEVTARVTYLYSCQVPLARIIVCRALASLFGLAPDAAALRNSRELIRHDPALAARIVREELSPVGNRAVARAMSFAETPDALYALLPTGARFAVLEAEASLPNQGAAYYQE